jgi:hypothetical protein
MLENEIKIFDAGTVQTLKWEAHLNGDYAKRYLLPLMEHGTRRFFDNIDATVMILTIDGFLMPLVLNHETAANAYVCSPFTYFIDYGMLEMRRISQPFVRKNLEAILHALKRAMRKDLFDKIVYVNNWLLATDLHPPLQPKHIEAIIAFLRRKFPEHTLAFRSINGFKDANRPAYFCQHGCDLIPVREVYYFEPQDQAVSHSRMFKSDLKVLRESLHCIEDGKIFEPQDIDRMVELYRALYIDKYSAYNPQLNANFFTHALANNLLNMKVLKRGGSIDAVVGYYEGYGEMTSPLFGYDTSLPQALGLYRQISTIINLEAINKNLLLNQSSGAASYKKLRRAKPEVDYLAIYTRHLPARRKIPWKALKVLMRYVGLPLIQKWNF